MEHRVFPWFNQMGDWENKIVKVKGYMDENRFFVRKERDGNYIFLSLNLIEINPKLNLIKSINNLRQTRIFGICSYANFGGLPTFSEYDGRDPPCLKRTDGQLGLGACGK